MATLLDNREHVGEMSFDDWDVNLEGSSSHLSGPGPDTEEETTTTTGPLGNQEATGDFTLIIDNIPPHLHPAVSMGMRQVNLCYFSVRSEGSNSVADLLTLIDDQQEHSATKENKNMNEKESSWSSSSSELLYHDILMNVFTYLDAPSL